MASRILSYIVKGRVMHQRHHPVENRFVYPVFFLLLNLDELDSLDSWLFGVNRWRPLSFYFADHADGSDPRAWVREQLIQGGIDDCTGSLKISCRPTVCAHSFTK